ncbi:MAG TPA: hypothetical protein VGE50_05155 [Gammaproteobacteria bacterium]
MFFVKTAFFVLLIILAGTLRAFEIDGFKSGMTVVDAELHAKAMGLSVSGSERTRYFSDITSATGPRFYGLFFCEGRLVNVQKHLKPRFDVFTS